MADEYNFANKSWEKYLAGFRARVNILGQAWAKALDHGKTEEASMRFLDECYKAEADMRKGMTR